MAQAIDRIVRLLERNLITPQEFFNNMLEVMQPVPERQATLGTLALHSSERVRDAAASLLKFVRNQDLSRDLAHIVRTSPLRPGIDLELFGDSYCYGPDDRRWWLSGLECCRATFLRFERLSGNQTPVALVELDEAIVLSDQPGYSQQKDGQTPKKFGHYAVLFARYGHESFAWELPQGSVIMSVTESLPKDLDAVLSEPFTDRHVCYRVQAPSGL